MPGASLWLVPPPSHPLHRILSELITTTLPRIFANESLPPFSPHLTLTSNISPEVYGHNPQQWLESIPWPTKDQVRVRLEQVKSEDVFVRRCYLKAQLEGVLELASLARARGVNNEDVPGPKTAQWIKEWTVSFGPHVSLAYGTFTIDEEKMDQVKSAVKAAHIDLTEEANKAGMHDAYDGWDGGVVWLVSTYLPVSEWKPIAVKEL